MSSSPSIEGMIISLIPSMICYTLWHCKNDRIFIWRRWCNLYAIHKVSSLVHEGCSRGKYSIDSSSFLPHNFRVFITDEQLVCKHFTVLSFSWKKPNEGWVKINVNCSVIGNPGVMGYRGIIRDCLGNLVTGFAKHLGVGTSLEAEAHGLHVGLQICIANHFTHV
ncbi:hypothetical protein ACH5RR_036930 [Cinchona calisaya]|uniref:RNase H type-1 domain-containing protein n=1 Tax=Cinchona calisaya TaxID=153742 RepID=A0ABD2Y6Y5_9GENT